MTSTSRAAPSPPGCIPWGDNPIEGCEPATDVGRVVEHDPAVFDPCVEIQFTPGRSSWPTPYPDPQIGGDTTSREEPPQGHGALEAVRRPRASAHCDLDDPRNPTGKLQIRAGFHPSTWAGTHRASQSFLDTEQAPVLQGERHRWEDAERLKAQPQFSETQSTEPCPPRRRRREGALVH